MNSGPLRPERSALPGCATPRDARQVSADVRAWPDGEYPPRGPRAIIDSLNRRGVSSDAVRAIARRKVYRQIDGYCAERRRFVDDGLRLPIRSNSPSPEERLLERERIDLAARVLREMNPRDREILTRFYLQEQTQEQICAGMAINATQFRLLKSRAKARFGDLGKERERLPRTLRMKRLATA